MADVRTLKKSYLREAKTGGRSTVAAQLTWLEEKRVEFQAEAHGGGWAVTSQGNEGASHTAAREIPVMDRLAAVLAAIEDLENASGTAVNRNRPGILLPDFSSGGMHT
jgi:hypothetical protein